MIACTGKPIWRSSGEHYNNNNSLLRPCGLDNQSTEHTVKRYPSYVLHAEDDSLASRSTTSGTWHHWSINYEHASVEYFLYIPWCSLPVVLIHAHVLSPFAVSVLSCQWLPRGGVANYCAGYGLALLVILWVYLFVWLIGWLVGWFVCFWLVLFLTLVW